MGRRRSFWKHSETKTAFQTGDGILFPAGCWQVLICMHGALPSPVLAQDRKTSVPRGVRVRLMKRDTGWAELP